MRGVIRCRPSLAVKESFRPQWSDFRFAGTPCASRARASLESLDAHYNALDFLERLPTLMTSKVPQEKSCCFDFLDFCLLVVLYAVLTRWTFNCLENGGHKHVELHALRHTRVFVAIQRAKGQGRTPWTMCKFCMSQRHNILAKMPHQRLM